MLRKLLPFLAWFDRYTLDVVKRDLSGGITVALVLIPQSMAYAQLAGLPIQAGLYASLLPPIIAILFGSSWQLATGPVAVVSLMTAAALEPIATTGSLGYISYALLLAFMVGLFQFLLGILKLGLIINLLSHPVINGFTNAAAIIIATSQLPKMLGVHIDTGDYHYETLIRVVETAILYTHWPTLLMGVLAFVIMIVTKRLDSRWPGVLVAVVVTTLISWALHFEHNIKINISAIHHAETAHLIESFNQISQMIPTLSEQRSFQKQKQLSAKKKDDIFAMLDARREVDGLTIQIDQLKYQVHLIRKKIRRLLFVQTIQPDGRISFMVKASNNQDNTLDKRIYRISVGNDSIDPNQVTFMGGGEVVGQIPKGMPSLKPVPFNISAFSHLLPFAVIIALLGFMEAISIAKAMAAKTGQRLDPNQELLGQGLANMASAFFSGYPVSGSFSRSAVNLKAGAVTGMSSVFSSLIVLACLLFFTPLFYHLPQSVLAAVIMMAVVGLINISGFVYAWRAKRHDGIISVLTFLSTLMFAPHLDKGLFVGGGLSLAVFLYKSMRPGIATLSLSADKGLHDALVFGLKTCRYIDVVRFDGPLFFANSSYLEEQIAAHRKNQPDLKHILLVSNGINDIDASGQETLSLLIDRIRSAGIDISLSGVNDSVMTVLERTHLATKIGKDHIFPNIHTALRFIHEKTHLNSEVENCPLKNVVYQTSETDREGSKG
ncbi:MAG: SulP family inorganic anion transporter [Desulfobacterales bacterium]|nr:SulP family inorganic anion transporter [Desulfobacterales bacterium]MDX2510783.1 SulP family inorganic anion transporter [Desulfobacterales bacterium]